MAHLTSMTYQRHGRLLVVSGPSGVGKGTVISGLLARQPEVRVSISCTTREPRPGEQDGREYYFVSDAEFDRRRDAGELLEWAEVYPGVYYGTPLGLVVESLAAGVDLILEIDDQGAQSVRRQLGEQAVLVFVAPPSFAALHDRLAGRQTETPEGLRERLDTAREEIGNLGLYAYLIVNDQVEPAVNALEAVLLAERHSLQSVDWQGLQARLLEEASRESLAASAPHASRE
jgi:guanylate kinase